MNNLSFLIYLLLQVIYLEAIPRFCNTDAECSTVLGASCSDKGMCQCEEGKIFSSDGTKCLDISPGFGSNCIDSAQCTGWILGPAVCSRGLCACERGHRHLQNQCLPTYGLGERCSIDADCYDEVDLFAMECNTNKYCNCSEGYYIRGEYDCRREGEDFENEKECFFDFECNNTEKKEICKLRNGIGPTGYCEEQKEEEEEESKIYLHNDYDNLLEDHENNYKLERDEPTDCKKDEDCADMANSFCPKFTHKCTCQNGFILDPDLTKKRQCLVALGQTCETGGNETCIHSKSYCNEDRKCQCLPYYIYSDTLDRCVKPTRRYEDSCATDKNCYSFGKYAACSDNKCVCTSGSEFDEENQLCLPPTVVSPCQNNCEHKPHSTCNNNNCECNENYESVNEECLPNLGQECGRNDCVIEDAKCDENNKCNCEENFVPLNNRSCIEMVADQNDTCTESIQCSAKLGEGWECNSPINGNCTCRSEYVYMNTTCQLKRSIGDRCKTARECMTVLNNENVECINGYCRCEYGYYNDEDNNGCISGGNTFTVVRNIVPIILIFTFINNKLY